MDFFLWPHIATVQRPSNTKCNIPLSEALESASLQELLRDISDLMYQTDQHDLMKALHWLVQ